MLKILALVSFLSVGFSGSSEACSLGNYKPVEKAKLAVVGKHITVRSLAGKVVSSHEFYTDPKDFDGGGTCSDLIYDYIEVTYKKMIRFEWMNCISVVKIVTPVNIAIPRGEREATVLSSSCVKPL
jgi:hypothetical protein